MSDKEAELPDETPNTNSFLVSDKGINDLMSWVRFQLELLDLTEESLWVTDENNGESLVYEARIPLLVFLVLTELQMRRIGGLSDVDIQTVIDRLENDE